MIHRIWCLLPWLPVSVLVTELLVFQECLSAGSKGPTFGGSKGLRQHKSRKKIFKDRRISEKSFASRNTEERLLSQLFANYDTDARGVSDNHETATVTIDLLLLRIQNLDERSQVLTTTGLIITEWRDERLQWDPAEFNNLTDIVVKPSRVWLPELALMNGADELAPDFRKIRVLINNTGDMHWEPGGIFMTTCDIDIRYFPFDEQSCIIQFGAWAYYSARMNITNGWSEIRTHDFRINGEWDIFKTNSVWNETILPCCPNTHYSYVEFTLYLRRRYAFYLMNIILPCTLLSILVMIVFCLPPDAGEKISLGISVLLAFTVFLLMVAENIPRTSLHIPIMVIYLTATMALGTVSVCLTVLVLNIHHRDDEECRVPNWARIIFLHYLTKILCIKSKIKQPMKRKYFFDTKESSVSLKSGLRKITKEAGLVNPMLQPNGDADSKFAKSDQIYPSAKQKKQGYNEWKELALVLDRLFFWIVFTLMTASILIILLVPYYMTPTLT